jgi:hypothetical protein
MAPRQWKDDGNRLYDTIRENVLPSSENPVRSALEETAMVLVTTAVGMTLLASPAAAQTTELGNALCGSGAGWVVTAAGILAAVYLTGKGMMRGIGAIDDAGSIQDEKRDMARKEAKGAGLSIFGGLVGVPFVGAMLGQLLPDSFGCIGFELNLLMITALPF